MLGQLETVTLFPLWLMAAATLIESAASIASPDFERLKSQPIGFSRNPKFHPSFSRFQVRGLNLGVGKLLDK
jgi:hypothetical protein